MKIVCEACAAKYSISDDKVRGKVFKIRCKKCSHIIVVRGDADQAPEEGPRAEQSAGDFPPSTASEAVWYVVVDGEQVGPLTEGDVGGRITRGEISGETFAWREGMADWIQVSAIAEFATALSAVPAGGRFEDSDSPFAPQPTAIYPPGTAESMFGDGAPSPSGSNAAKRSEATEVFGAASLGHAPAGQDLFAPQSGGDPFGSTGHASSSSGSGGGGFFNVPGTAPAPSSGGGGGLTAQRSENSVLFSLSNLEALAAPSPVSSPSFGGGYSSSARPTATAAPAQVTEGSGLIDIRSMAAMTLGKPATESSFTGSLGRPTAAAELPTFSAAPLSPMSPMLMPTRPAGGVPGYVWGLVALVVLLMAGFTFMLTRSPPAPVAIATSPAPTAPSVAVAPGAPPATAQPPAPAATAPSATDEPLPPREQAPPTATAEKTGGSSKRSGSGSSKRTSSSGSSSGKAAAPADEAPAVVASKPAPEAAPPKKGSLDDLLSGAIGTTPKKSAPAAAPTPASEPAKKLGALSKSDIVKGMMGIGPKTSACYQQYKVPGTANVTVKVGSSGKVDDAQVTGKFAGTPTGECVEKAVKTAKFPPSDGLSFPYPIPLR